MFANTVTVRRKAPSGTDAYGNEDGTYADVDTHPARVQHHNSWEDREGRLLNIQNWRAYLEPTVDVKEDDLLYWDDEDRLFEIIVVEPVYDTTGIHHKYLMLQEMF
jgi:hypothetical protein